MIDRAKYYGDYYNCKKWIYRERYLQKKWSQEMIKETYYKIKEKKRKKIKRKEKKRKEMKRKEKIKEKR